MNTNELLPCPFCGSDNFHIEKGNTGFWMICDDCMATGPYDLGISGARERWNERAVINENK